jgi:peptidoglycan/xylan/chitin deacetylase (PgdA/CDA1 family)
VRLALTFDDGPGPDTEALLDLLAREAWPATFFVLGKNVAEAPWAQGDAARAQAIVVRELQANHVVGCHTYSHLKPERYLELAADLARGDEVVRACRRAAGHEPDAPIVFRLPYGIRFVERTVAVDTGTLNVATLDPRLPVITALGRTHTHWTCDFADWAARPGDGPAMAEKMLEHLDQQLDHQLPAVFCLHDGGTGSSHGYVRRATVDALAIVLPEARRRGWTPFTVPG